MVIGYDSSMADNSVQNYCNLLKRCVCALIFNYIITLVGFSKKEKIYYPNSFVE